MKISINIKFIIIILIIITLMAFLISYYMISSIEGYYIKQRAMALFTQGNFIINSLRDDLDSDLLVYNLRSLSNQFGYRIIVTDNNATVISDSRSQQDYTGQRLNLPEISSALQGNGTYGVYDLREAGHVIYLSSPIVTNKVIVGTILISSSIADIYDFINHINNMTRWILLATVLFSVVIASILSTGITKRLLALSKASKRISQGHLDTKVNTKGNDEITNLGVSFNNMVNKLNLQEQKRREFIANISHEIKTPLASIKALSEALIDDDTSPIELYRDFLNDIIQETDRLTSLTNDFLSLAKLEGSTLHINLTSINLNEIVKETCKQMEQYALKNGLKLIYDHLEPITIIGDKEKLKQVLINIIDNSIKYSEEGKKIVVELKKQKNYAKITIQDFGIGISKDNIDNIFDYFYRADQARSRDTGGTGLGLKIAKTIVNLHRGDISVTSTYNQGSTFVILLPLENKF